MSRRVPVEAVTLDAAGTLIRVAEPVAESYARIAAESGARLDLEAVEAAFAEEFTRMPAMAFAHHPRPAPVEVERDWWRQLVARVVARAGGVHAFERYFDALYEYFADADAWRCYAEVPATLDALRALGVRLAVVSNFDSRLPGILRGLGIAEHFDAVVYSTACGAAKPDPDIFRHALARLGIPAQAALHVGDHLQADYHGARAAGMAALLVLRQRAPPGGDIDVIDDLGELAQRLQRARGD